MEFLKEFINFIIHDDLSAIPIAFIFLFIMMGIDSKRVEEEERRRTKRATDERESARSKSNVK